MTKSGKRELIYEKAETRSDCCGFIFLPFRTTKVRTSGTLFNMNLLFQAVELGSGLEELCPELLVVQQSGKNQSTNHLTGLDIAVMMEADNPTAVTKVQTAFVELVLPFGIDSGKNHRYSDSGCAVS